MPKKPRSFTFLLLGLYAVGLCACSDSTTSTNTSTTDSAFESAFTCDELADRWVALQQGYLDRLDDADEIELEEASDRVKGAGLWIAQATLEQVRDTQAAGCSEVLASGSIALCSRVSQLHSRGEAGDAVISGLTDRCA